MIGEYSTVAALNDLVDVEMEALPGFEELADPLPDFRSSLVDPGTLGPEHRILPFNVRAEEGDERICVSSVQGTDASSDDLHVLLRHRLLRQPSGFEEPHLLAVEH